MFDFRYHALSLTAVIVSLVLGVLLGVAIGDKGLLSSTEKKIRASLKHDVITEHQRAEDLNSALHDRNDVERKLYPLLTGGQLAGREVGIVFLGPSSDADKNLVHQAIDPAGANVRWVLAFAEPLDADGLAAKADGTRYVALAATPDLYYPFGRRIGVQLAAGGKLVERERSTLADSFNGTLAPTDTIVLVRNSPTGMTKVDARNTGAFEKGLVRGLTNDAAATVVGVQTQSGDRKIGADWYAEEHLTYVSDIDQVEGRVSLVYALAGLSNGSFGRGSGEQLVPDVAEAVTTP